MQIEVVVTGNRSLYRSIYEGIDRTTRHRTASGAARAVLKAEVDAKGWARSCGDWGSYTLRIDGRTLTKDEQYDFHATVWSALQNRDWVDPADAIAKAIEAMCD